MIKFNLTNARYGVFSADGRLWVKTLTRAKAVKYAEDLKAKNGLLCTIKELQTTKEITQ